ncbi:unnamed protein product, partial [Nesidiocoris tenuis]
MVTTWPVCSSSSSLFWMFLSERQSNRRRPFKQMKNEPKSSEVHFLRKMNKNLNSSCHMDLIKNLAFQKYI